MGPIRAVGQAYGRMFNFSGRARRAEYWWFYLWMILLFIGAFSVLGLYGETLMAANPELVAALQDADRSEAAMLELFRQYGLIGSVGYLLIFGIPYLSLTIRRLHDTDRSGWNIFMPMLVAIVSALVGGFAMAGAGSEQNAVLIAVLINVPPLIASIVFLVWMCSAGTNGNNRFGPDPIGPRTPDHPAFAQAAAPEAQAEMAEVRKQEAQDYYRTHVLPSIQRS